MFNYVYYVFNSARFLFKVDQIVVRISIKQKVRKSVEIFRLFPRIQSNNFFYIFLYFYSVWQYEMTYIKNFRFMCFQKLENSMNG